METPIKSQLVFKQTTHSSWGLSCVLLNSKLKWFVMHFWKVVLQKIKWKWENQNKRWLFCICLILSLFTHTQKEITLCLKKIFIESQAETYTLTPYCSFLSESRSSKAIILRFDLFSFSEDQWVNCGSHFTSCDWGKVAPFSWILSTSIYYCLFKTTSLIQISHTILPFLMDPDCTTVSCGFMAENEVLAVVWTATLSFFTKTRNQNQLKRKPSKIKASFPNIYISTV